MPSNPSEPLPLAHVLAVTARHWNLPLHGCAGSHAHSALRYAKSPQWAAARTDTVAAADWRAGAIPTDRVLGLAWNWCY